MGLYTAPERVERDGRLICYAGEIMSMEEAERRGLLDEKPAKDEKAEAPKKAAPRKRAPKKAAPKE